MNYRTLIVDDEPPARFRLQQLLADFPEVEVIDEAENGMEACEKINRIHPDLVFLDIKMPGMNGFEVLMQLKHNPIIIFCTAYDQYALRAFETKTIDYLVKPVTKARLQLSIEKIKSINFPPEREDFINLIKEFSNQASILQPKSIPVKSGDKVRFIRLSDILYFKASDKYVDIFDRKGNTYLTELSLRNLEDKLPHNFIRIHRRYIINTNEIEEVHKYLNARYVFILNKELQQRLISGRTYQSAIKSMLDF